MYCKQQTIILILIMFNFFYAFNANANMILNGDFQLGSLHWTYDEDAVSIFDDNGNNRLKVVTDVADVHKTTNGWSYLLITHDEMIAVNGDNLFKLSYITKTPKYGVGYLCEARVRFYDTAGNELSYKFINTVHKESSWITTQLHVAAPVNASYAKIAFLVWSKGTEVYVDNVIFEQVNKVINLDLPAKNNQLSIIHDLEYIDNQADISLVKNAKFAAIMYLWYKCYETSKWDDLLLNLALAKDNNIPVYVSMWLSEISPSVFRDEYPFVTFDGTIYAHSPSFFHEAWWDNWFIPKVMMVVNKSVQYNIKGINIDFELYDTPNNVNDVCYCDDCLHKFEQQQEISIQGETTAQKTEWLLKNNYLAAYRQMQINRVSVKLLRLRQQVDNVNPAFSFGELPYYDHLFDQAFVENLGTAKAPFLIMLESTYFLQSDNYSDSIGVRLAAGKALDYYNKFKSRNYKFILLPGVSPFTSTDFLEKKTKQLMTVAGGYWLWSKSHIDSMLRKGPSPDYKIFTLNEANAIWNTLRRLNHAPVLQCELDENEGNIIHDTEIYKCDGILQGDTTWTSGRRNSAITFDGDHDYIDFGDPNNGNLDFSQHSFSYAMWVYVDENVGDYDMALFKGGSSATVPGYNIALGNKYWVANISDGVQLKSVLFSHEPIMRKWVHLAVVIDRTNHRLSSYVDGKFANSIDITNLGTLDNSFKLILGAAYSGNHYPFKGKIDDFRIYSYALNATEIEEIAQGAVVYINFDELTGDLAYNNSMSGKNNHGSLEGDTAWVDGHIGDGAVEFDGDHDYIDFGDPDNDNLNFAQHSFSYAMWVYVDENVGDYDMALFKGGSSATVPGYNIALGNKYWVANISDGVQLKSVLFSHEPIMRKWVHLAVVIDRTNHRLSSYVDGKFANSIDITNLGTLDNSFKLILGAAYSGNHYPFKGKIDDFRIYDRILSAVEISRLAEN